MLRLAFTFVSFAIMLCGCDPRYGFIESQFQLSPESRLPKWIEHPEENSREKFDVRITYYTFKKAKIVVYGPPDNKVIFRKVGRVRWHPETEKQFEYGKKADYPTYDIITVKGVSEVFEKRKDGPILFITDDPRLTSIIASPDKGKTSKNIE